MFLEIAVEVENKSNSIWTIPCVYVSARALVDTESLLDYTGKEGFGQLSECGQLSEEINRAYFEKTITQIAPHEIVSFVRYDRLKLDFAKRFPVVVVNVEVSGAHEALAKPPFRAKWLRYMKMKESEPRRYNIFSRFDPDESPPLAGFSSGDRYLRRIENGSYILDGETSADFKWFLTSYSRIAQWSRFLTVNLREALSRDAAKSEDNGRH